jgi:phosphatidylserine decarboxylase
MIGATNVGSIELSFPRERPARNRPPSLPAHVTQALAGPTLVRGEEFGRFNLGSTVILLTSHKLVTWDPALTAGKCVRMGEALGRIAARR